jgi:hypothetical protein
LFTAAAAAGLACSSNDESTVLTQPVAAKLDLMEGRNDFGMMLGISIRLRPVLVSVAGDTLDMPAGFTLVSRNPANVSVDSGTWIHARTMNPGTWVVGSVPYHGTTLTDSVNASVSCTLELIIGVSPSTISVAVGETSAAPVVTLKTCGGQINVNDTFTWTVADATIASVNTTTGAVTGLKVGQTSITVRGATHSFIGSIAVTVR